MKKWQSAKIDECIEDLACFLSWTSSKTAQEPLLTTLFWLKAVLVFFQEPPRALLDEFFSVQEASKRLPRGLQEAKGRLNRFWRPPGGLQDRFGSDFGAILETF